MLKVVQAVERLPLVKDQVHVWRFKDAGKENVQRLLEFYSGTREFQRTKRGKPFLPGSDVRFNLSHSGELTVCAFCLGMEVGIDVERENRKVEHTRLADRFFTAEEAEAVRIGGQAVFLRLWTRKEAYVKALGLGIAAKGLDSFSAMPGQARVTGAALGECRIWDLDFEPGYMGAVAVQVD